MTALQEAERLLPNLTRAEKALLAQRLVADLANAFPGVEIRRGGSVLGAKKRDMKTSSKSKSTKQVPDDIALVESVLGKEFPVVTVKRPNSLMLRVRIIDQRFRKLSKVARHEMVEPLLEELPEELQESIYFVLLLAPEEVAASSMNEDFENPQPSLIA